MLHLLASESGTKRRAEQPQRPRQKSRGTANQDWRSPKVIEQVDAAELSPGEFAHRVRTHVEKHVATTVVIDSLNGYQTAMPEEQCLILHMHELLQFLNRQGCGTFLTVAQHGLIGEMKAPIDVTFLADTVILMRYFEASGRVRRAISVIKKRSGPHEDTIRELKITSRGMVVGEPLERFHGAPGECAMVRIRKTLYLVRHCKAVGQQPEAALTDGGHLQAKQLAEQLAALPIERIISSPFVRAKQSIAPLAVLLGIPIATDKRLAERVLAAGDLPEWLAALKSSFDDLDRCFAGGESSRAAMQRASEVVSEAMAHPVSTTLLVTHGNLMTLLLKHFDDRIGFAEWRQLTNPDVYRITPMTGRAEITRIWDT